MFNLPPEKTQFNRDSLLAFENWLRQLCAERSKTDACSWEWMMPQWSAEIQLEVDELRVTWNKDGQLNQCSFPYGLSRKDVQIVISEGP